MKIDLGDGDWALLRHANKIPHSKTLEYRKVFYEVVAAGSVDAGGEDQAAAAGRAIIEHGGLNLMEDLANALILAVVSEWSYGPVDLPTLLDVPTADLDEIADHCGGEEYTKMLQPSFEQDMDPESPTKPSAP